MSVQNQNITNTNNKRIAKNTLFLYIRMGISMIVQLYTSRVVLQNLGVIDYGVYNVVAAFIIAFTYISGPLGTATQRFLNFELGKKQDSKVELVFNISLYIYIILGISFFLIVEIVGIWFLNNRMQIPIDRLNAANFVFHMSTLAIVFNLLKTPFESLIIAHERMAFYAYVSIVDVLLKLLNAASLIWFTFDKLKLYSVNLLVISIVILFCFIIFCNKQFQDISFNKLWDKNIFKEMLSFSGWSLFGSIATMTSNQGLSIVLNLFYGVVINAAMGIAGQVSSAITQFATNFQIAFRPQIVKYYASNDIQVLKSLINRTSKYSYLLLFVVVCPLCFNIDFILEKWLGNVPKYAVVFCICMSIYALIDTLSAPMWMAIQATGTIKKYQLVISSVMFLNIILAYIFLKLGFRPSIVLEVKCVLDILYLCIRLYFLKILISFSIIDYIKDTIIKILTITTLSTLPMIVLNMFYYEKSWKFFLMSSMFFTILFSIEIWSIVLSKGEKDKLRSFVVSKIKR